MAVIPEKFHSEPAVMPAAKRRLRITPDLVAGIIGAIFIITLVLTAIFAAEIAPYDPTKRLGRPFQAPSQEHILGTNDIGQDIFSELVFGTRISLMVGVVAAFVSITIGTLIGIVAGFCTTTVGRILMRFVDVVLTLPFLPMLILFAAYLGRSTMNTILVIGLLSWAGTARIIRSRVICLTMVDYVKASRSVGANDFHVIFKHIFPQVMLLAMEQFINATSSAILLEASLSFLGLGDPLQKSWGSVLYWAQVRGAFLSPAWKWWVLPPGLLIGMSSLGFALLGFYIERIINPRLNQT